MRVLGIESSCDETGVALVECDVDLAPVLRAQALHSQAEMHADYGGVVPELASRDHIRRVLPLARQVLADAGCALDDLDLDSMPSTRMVGAGSLSGLRERG